MIPGITAGARADYDAVVLADSPLAYWPLQDALNTNPVADVSGNSRHMTISGAESLQAGARNAALGRALSFPAVNGFGSVAAAAWHQLTGDMTLELWVCVHNPATTVLTLMSCTVGGGASLANNRLYQWALLTGADKGIGCYHEFGSGSVGANTFTEWDWTAGRWHHLVLVRDTAAQTYTFYADGVSVGVESYATNPAGGTNSVFNINRVADGGLQIDSASFCRAAVYGTKLSAARVLAHYLAGGPTSSLAWESTVFLCNFQGADTATTTTDDCGRARDIAWHGGAAIDTAQAVPGLSSSLLLDGAGDYVDVADTPLHEIGGSQFTIEAFIRIGTLGRVNTICSKRDGAGAEEHTFAVNSDNTLGFSAFASGSAVVTLTSATTLTTGQWYHVAAQRIAGNVWTLHIDGTLVDSDTVSTTATTNSGGFTIGRDPSNTANDFAGWIGGLRFTHSMARYPAGSFTPPDHFRMYT